MIRVSDNFFHTLIFSQRVGIPSNEVSIVHFSKFLFSPLVFHCECKLTDVILSRKFSYSMHLTQFSLSPLLFLSVGELLILHWHFQSDRDNIIHTGFSSALLLHMLIFCYYSPLHKVDILRSVCMSVFLSICLSATLPMIFKLRTDFAEIRWRCLR